MDIHCFIVLAFILAIVQIEASIATSRLQFNFPECARFDSTSDTDVPATRFLRISSTGDGSEEERAGPSVPIFESVKTMFSSSKITPEKLQSWFGKRKSADIMFKRLHLHQTGRSLFSNRHFTVWVMPMT
ncbi:Avirulence protein (Avh) [Phytophthora palmivora]|uniref:RxLR effector protein n=1 Tax=Phytophthora palmivora TaxID=4796 RepID=A0A2P4WX53_9STRA|nr:Avirulence protein (Avh) [Phytophthora palmivora]